MSCDTNQKQIYSKSKFHVTQKAMKSIKDIKLEHIQQLFHNGINRIGIVHYILDLFLWEHINIPVRKFTNWFDFVHFNIIYLRTNPNKPTWWASQLSAHKYHGPQINWWTFYKVLVKSDFTSEEKIIKFQRDRSCFNFFFLHIEGFIIGHPAFNRSNSLYMNKYSMVSWIMHLFCDTSSTNSCRLRVMEVLIMIDTCNALYNSKHGKQWWREKFV
jgi:hypothetical protein